MSGQSRINPYQSEATNLIYNLLFCDDLLLYKESIQSVTEYPFDLLFKDNISISDLQKLIADENLDSRIRLLAYNRILSLGHIPATKELLGVIVEIGLEEGLDTLAAYLDGSARYINYSGKIIIWESNPLSKIQSLIDEFMEISRHIVKQIGPWDQPRKENPETGFLRLTFLVSDGIYFGEGPIDVLFADQMAMPALMKATEILRVLTESDI